jgi:hypothetical protein
MERQAQQAHAVIQARKVLLDLLAIKDLREQKVTREILAHKAFQ